MRGACALCGAVNEGEGSVLFLWRPSALCSADLSVTVISFCRVWLRCMHAACTRVVRLGQGACDFRPRAWRQVVACSGYRCLRQV